MKPTDPQRSDLLLRMRDARARLDLSFAAIGERAGVDASQVSRICRGEFATFSDSVVQICKVLGVEVGQGPRPRPRTPVAGAPADLAWAKLVRSVRRAWDGTPAGAERLSKVIAAVADLAERRPGSSGGADA